MISEELFTITSKLTSTYGQDRNALTELMPIFAGIIVMTQREFFLYLLDVELDWLWQKQPQKKPANALIISSE